MNIPVKPKARAKAGDGSASPRYELYTVCCNMWLASDHDLSRMRATAERQYAAQHDKLVIYDLDAKDGA